jgi:hypothetical protein
MTYIQLGSLMIPSAWITVFLSLFITPVLFKGLFKKKVEDWYWNGFFVYILTWKVSYILFNLMLFLETPVSILYFNGGMKGTILALVVLSLYLFFVARKKYAAIVGESGQVFLMFLLSYGLINSIVEGRSTEAILHFIVLTGYFLILYFKKVEKMLILTQVYVVIIMLDLLITSVFQSLFTLEVLNFTWIGITILILISKKGEKRYE